MPTVTSPAVVYTAPDVPPADVPIHQALAAVMRDVQAIGKDQVNTAPGQNYKFRGIDAVMNTVGPVLRRHGVVPLPMGSKATYRDVQTSTGKPAREVTVKAKYRLVGPQGDFLDVETPGESMDSGDKGTAKAMSVALRILFLQMFVIPTGDTDPDSQTYERAAAPRAQARSQPPAKAPTPRPEKTPLDKAKEAVMAAGKALKLTVEEIKSDYAQWATDPDAPDNGTPTNISEADEATLNAYTAYLTKIRTDQEAADALDRAQAKVSKDVSEGKFG